MKNGSEPAYPFHKNRPYDKGYHEGYPGLSKREKIATAVLQGLAAREYLPN